ncbi:MAG TPA: hypothetical protein VEO54_01700 [Thermoanaerobaculia bacterium]|nr:hypothetical protein [Thermoanaerobaculia bacterium]
MTRRLPCAALVVAVLAPAFAATPPAAQLRGETLGVSLPGGLLAETEVRKRLNSGLTTTFVVVATLDDERTSGARVDIRFEPWDEVYFITLRRIGARPQSHRAGSFAQLETWWRETSLPLFTAAAETKRVQVAVDVIPFSAEEQEETQRWLTRSLGEARQPAPPPVPADQGPNPRASASGSVLDVLIGTSIQRRPIFRRRWQVGVTR